VGAVELQLDGNPRLTTIAVYARSYPVSHLEAATSRRSERPKHDKNAKQPPVPELHRDVLDRAYNEAAPAATEIDTEDNLRVAQGVEALRRAPLIIKMLPPTITTLFRSHHEKKAGVRSLFQTIVAAQTSYVTATWTLRRKPPQAEVQ
jgi:hypothetical protein